jgi:hypothetical protein
MITKEDHEPFAEWCRDQLPLYDAVVCLDGSTSDETARIAGAYNDRIVYLHERDHRIRHATDHGLRAIVHDEIVRRFGPGGWVMCCHADEFCYHDPRKIAALAERCGCDLVSWFTRHFYPHPSERADWPNRCALPLRDRFRHYHWSYRGSGLPWIEDRLYKAALHVAWDGVTQGSVRPLGIRSRAPFHPILRHYKVTRVDADDFEVSHGSSFYRHHWQEQVHRTGVAFLVRRSDDLFVSAVPNYARCDRFEGRFPQAWSIGDEFCPDGRAALIQARSASE